MMITTTMREGEKKMEKKSDSIVNGARNTVDFSFSSLEATRAPSTRPRYRPRQLPPFKSKCVKFDVFVDYAKGINHKRKNVQKNGRRGEGHMASFPGCKKKGENESAIGRKRKTRCAVESIETEKEKTSKTHQVDARPLDRAARYFEQQMSRKTELL